MLRELKGANAAGVLTLGAGVAFRLEPFDKGAAWPATVLVDGAAGSALRLDAPKVIQLNGFTTLTVQDVEPNSQWLVTMMQAGESENAENVPRAVRLARLVIAPGMMTPGTQVLTSDGNETDFDVSRFSGVKLVVAAGTLAAPGGDLSAFLQLKTDAAVNVTTDLPCGSVNDFAAVGTPSIGWVEVGAGVANTTGNLTSTIAGRWCGLVGAYLNVTTAPTWSDGVQMELWGYP